jgi:hypothetical protein
MNTIYRSAVGKSLPSGSHLIKDDIYERSVDHKRWDIIEKHRLTD